MNRSFTHAALALGLALSATVASAAMNTSTLANGKSVYGAAARNVSMTLRHRAS